MIHPVILSGGSGTRLWPMSRTLYPKQLLTLLGDESLLQQTVRRVADPGRFAPPLLVANEEHRFIIAEQLREIAVAPWGLLLEPVGRNTAPAACVAALALIEAESDPLMLLLPSDHAIGDVDAFLAAIDRAAAAASGGALATFGITPERAETGYGYIRRGGTWDGANGVFAVAEFREKPALEQAERFLASGEHSWNSGIFLFPAQVYLAELERLRPEMVAACRTALAEGSRDKDFIRLDKEAFCCVRRGFDRLRGDGAHSARGGRAGRHGLERCWLLGRAVGDEPEGPIRQRARRQRRRRRRPQLLSAFGSRAGRRDRGRGSRRRRHRRCGDGGAPRPHPGSPQAGGAARPRASRGGRRAADGPPPVGYLCCVAQGASGAGQAHYGQARRSSCRCSCIITAPSTGSSFRAPPRCAAGKRR